MRYVPPRGPTVMWFIAHATTAGCESVLSIDFERALETLPDQDHTLEPEFEYLRLPLHTDLTLVSRSPLHDVVTMSCRSVESAQGCDNIVPAAR